MLPGAPKLTRASLVPRRSNNFVNPETKDDDKRESNQEESQQHLQFSSSRQILSYSTPRIKIAFRSAESNPFITRSGRLVTKTYRVTAVS